MTLNYTRSLSKLPQGYEIRVTNTGAAWAVYRHGRKLTAFINSPRSHAFALVAAFMRGAQPA